MPYPRLGSSLLLACCFVLAACSQPPSPSQTPERSPQVTEAPTEAPPATASPTIRAATVTATLKVVSTDPPAPTSTQPAPTQPSPTQPVLKLSDTPTLPESTPVPLQTASTGLLRDGEELPENLAVLRAENVGKLAEIARWGKGGIGSLAYAQDGSTVAVLTGEGVYYYETQEYDLLRFVPLEVMGNQVTFSPSLAYLALGIGKRVEVWDLENGRLFRQFQIEEDVVGALAFTPDSSQLYGSDFAWTRRNSKHIYIWDIEKGTLLQAWDRGSEAFAFSADGQVHASLESKKITIWKDDLALPWHTLETEDYFTDIALSPDGNLLALVDDLGDWESFVQVWKVESGELWQEFYLQTPATTSLQFPPYAPLKVWAKGSRRPSLLGGPGRYSISDLTFSPNGQILAARNMFGFQHQWRLQDGALLHVDKTNGDQLTYSPGGDVLVTWGHTAEFRQADNGRLTATLGNHAGSIYDLEFGPDGDSLASGSADGQVWWRRARDGGIIRILKTSEKDSPATYFSTEITSLAYARDGSLIAAGTLDGQIYVWSTTDGESRTLGPIEDAQSIRHISLSFDNQYLALGAYEAVGAIIDLSNGSFRYLDFLGPEEQFAFSPAAPLFAMKDYRSNQIKLFNLPGLEAQKTLGVGGILVPPIFSQDGQLLAIGTSDKVIEVWDVNGATLMAHFTSEQEVNGFVITPDNELLIALTWNAVKVYEISSQKLLYSTYLYGESLAISPDGRLLAVGDWDGVVHLLGVLP